MLWRYLKINRSMSNAAVSDGLVFIADPRG